MKKSITKIILVCISLACLIGCASAFTDVKIQHAIDSGQIQIGSSMYEVSSAIGEPVFFCKKKTIKEDTTYEIWDYSSGRCLGSNWAHSYVLIFKDGYLHEISQY